VSEFEKLAKVLDAYARVPLPAEVSDDEARLTSFTTSMIAAALAFTDKAVWALDGTFVNLYEGVLDGDICRPGLIQDDATAEWFEQAVGTGTDLMFSWYSDRHGPLDSYFVLDLSNHVNYMASVPNPAMLLASNVDVDKEYTFVIHGTPVGVLAHFTGRFTHLHTPAIGCAIN
jgi:hypothetical protein